MKQKKAVLAVLLGVLIIGTVVYGASTEKFQGLMKGRGSEMFDLHSQSCFEYLPALTLGLRPEGTNMVMPLKTKCKEKQKVECLEVTVTQHGLKLGHFKIKHNGKDITDKTSGLNGKSIDAGNGKNKVKEKLDICFDPKIEVKKDDDLTLEGSVEAYDTSFFYGSVDYSVKAVSDGK